MTKERHSSVIELFVNLVHIGHAGAFLCDYWLLKALPSLIYARGAQYVFWLLAHSLLCFVLDFVSDCIWTYGVFTFFFAIIGWALEPGLWSCLLRYSVSEWYTRWNSLCHYSSVPQRRRNCLCSCSCCVCIYDSCTCVKHRADHYVCVFINHPEHRADACTCYTLCVFINYVCLAMF
jgi:hypothetical protein